MKHLYFVSYSYKLRKGYGEIEESIGCTGVEVEEPVTSMDDVLKLKNLIEQGGFAPCLEPSVVILNFQLLSVELPAHHPEFPPYTPNEIEAIRRSAICDIENPSPAAQIRAREVLRLIASYDAAWRAKSS